MVSIVQYALTKSQLECYFLESRNDLKQKRQVCESHKSDVLSLQVKSAKMNAVDT